eukprot:sb/3477061/
MRKSVMGNMVLPDYQIQLLNNFLNSVVFGFLGNKYCTSTNISKHFDQKVVHVGSLQALGYTQKKLAHEISYLDYSIPSFKVPGVSGALLPLEVCLWHENHHNEFLLVLRLC